MAKMTLDGLHSFVATYVDKSKQAGEWIGRAVSVMQLMEKIGKQITIDGSFEDKLPELDGEDLPYGKTIEEWFVDLILPTTFTKPEDGQTYGVKYVKPSVEQASYCYTLGRRKLETSKPYDDYERAALGATEAADFSTKIVERLYNSESLYKYAQKKQLLANMIAKAEAATNASTLVQTIAAPTDTNTAEAFIKQVKEDVETAGFANEGHNLGNCLIGAAPEMTLFIKKGVMPTIEVDALAGAFNRGDLAIPAKIKVVDDFGDNATGVYAMLVDTRGVKLHNGYRAIRTDEHGGEDFVTFTLHSENTGFISKYTFLKVYKSA